MSSQHLSDEAVAAFADGVLSGHARERASRHTGECAECARAVRIQREAVFALRAAPAPALPVGLLDRLRSVPATTVIGSVPAALAPDGSAMFASFGALAGAALVPAVTSTITDTASAPHRARRMGPFVLTAAAVAVAGVLAVASSGSAAASRQEPVSPAQARVVPAELTDAGDGSAAVQPRSLVSYHRP
jgi:anti-sigma factor RsiW